jgi:hypothetical protein
MSGEAFDDGFFAESIARGDSTLARRKRADCAWLLKSGFELVGTVPELTIVPAGTDLDSGLKTRVRVALAAWFPFAVEVGWFATATDFTWATAVIPRQALRTMAAKTRVFMVVLTLSQGSERWRFGWGIQLPRR